MVTLGISQGKLRVTVNDRDSIPKDTRVINYYLTQVADINNDYVTLIESLNSLAMQLPITTTNIEDLHIVCNNALDKYSVNFTEYSSVIAQEMEQ